MNDNKLSEFVNGLPLDEKVKKELLESLQQTLDTIKESSEEQVRKELAEKYEQDMKTLKEGIAELMETKIGAFEKEIENLRSKFAKDKIQMAKKLDEAKYQFEKDYKKKKERLEAKYKERDRRRQKILENEIKENKEAIVAAITEVKTRAMMERKELSKRAATIIEKVVTDHLRASIEPLMEDIKEARKKKFGMELFEAFEDAYKKAFLARNKPIKQMIAEANREKIELSKKLMEAQKEKDKALIEAKVALKKAKKIQEKALRESKIATLVSKLPTETARKTMRAILESAPIEKMDDIFNAQKSKIIREDAKFSKKRMPITESKKSSKIEKVGFSTNKEIDSLDNDPDIVYLRECLKR